MTTEEILKVAEILSKKYRNSQEREDLMQEGILAALEALESTTDKPTIVSCMKLAMQEYYNKRKTPLSVPVKSGTLKSLVAKIKQGQTEFEGIELAMYHALTTQPEMLEGNIPDSHDPLDYLDAKQVFEGMVGILDSEEYMIITQRYFNDLTQEEVADYIGTSRKSVSLKEKKAVDKLTEFYSA